ncbi:LacI family DNA-binding transcriptional regulator [Nocardiopsis changdeensis]|uniref:LacI family DNA-binding transcriptional regulator n=1 Tax=Nocardiopsis changdeensis TaxID=2831969 RepID=A0ABX8BT48_9ACTN|nr:MULTISPECIES: LacI family DNA-binding transcriptional regulator [Nocardiopsis]QUX23923.1 LacI family DNA-binding transcriptional regulator [Nocardiopsis changdeensis]QYX39869.1 LacI family transcriptional regulator [Nocardiopsis sp. MT53]
MRRPTIMDIAKAAGVSKGAVSYALNGRPGVSQETRERILAIAHDLGWAPSSTARALSPGGRVGAFGLVIDRPARFLGVEPFFMQLVSGIEAELAVAGTDLLLQVTDDRKAEEGVYRRWFAERRVDGVIIVDLRVDDPRIALVDEVPLPAVVLGGPGGAGSLPCLYTDDASSVREVVHYLAALGHRRVVRVAGPDDFVHTRDRTRAFEEAAAEAGLPGAVTVHSDYTGESGARTTRRLLARADRPTALVYDNDLMAVAGLGVAREMGVDVPGQLSIVAWDDSVLCQVVHPSLTAVARDVVAAGREVARMLAEAVEGGPVGSRETVPGELQPRGSTGPMAG